MSETDDRLADLIAEHNDIHQHLQALHDLVVDEDAIVVVELGTAMGRSATAFLAGLEKVTGDGMLWTVDIERNAELFPWVRDHPHALLNVANDLDVVDECPKPIDLLFIDSAHEHDHTLAEMVAYVPLVRSGGWVVMHDTELCYSVHSAITDYMEVEGAREFASVEWRLHCNGLFLGQLT